MVLGPASVVEAIGQGRRAAEQIDRFLGGDGDMQETLAEPEDLSWYPPLRAETKARLRPKVQLLKPSTRVKGFSQVEKVWSKEEAMQEASRCLRCDLED